MKFRPILFSTPMVQAILDGRKTQTRRLCNPYPWDKPCKSDYDYYDHQEGGHVLDSEGLEEYLKNLDLYNKSQKPKYNVDDILWVRETWQQETKEFETEIGKGWVSTGRYVYRTDNVKLPEESEGFGKWRPSIHMPKEAARIFLEVTDVRVEKLQDISKKDAIAEGIKFMDMPDPLKGQGFVKDFTVNNWHDENPIYLLKSLWQSIYGAESWEQNPYVWVYSLERVEKPENFLK